MSLGQQFHWQGNQATEECAAVGTTFPAKVKINEEWGTASLAPFLWCIFTTGEAGGEQTEKNCVWTKLIGADFAGQTARVSRAVEENQSRREAS